MLINKHNIKKLVVKNQIALAVLGVIGLFVLWQVYDGQFYKGPGIVLTEAIAPKNELDNQKPIDLFSANVLLNFNKQPPGDKNVAVPFSWNLFFNLNAYFDSIREDKLKGLTCEGYSGKIGRPKSVVYNCKDTPNGNVPIALKSNIVLYLSKKNRVLYKNLYLETTMPLPKKLLYMFPGYPEVFLKFDVVKSEKVELETVDLAEQINTVKSVLKADISPKKQVLPSVLLSPEHFDIDRAPKLDIGPEFKYFGEAYTLGEPLGSKLDYRFFNKDILGEFDLKNIKIQQLMRGWIHFARLAGVNWWLTHSSLIGWYWNGFHLPFQSRATVQLPIGDLFDKLIPYNQSIIFDYMDSTTGHYGSFFLDINPFSINGGNDDDGKKKENLMDARFIDMTTGLMLDISGARGFKPEGGLKGIHRELTMGTHKKLKKMIADSKYETILYDKEHNFTPLEEILPLVPVHYDNELAYIPSHYSKILKDENDVSLTRSSKAGYKFRNYFKLWIPVGDCKLKIPWLPTSKEDDLQCLSQNKELKTKSERFSYFMDRHLKEKNQVDALIKRAKDYNDVSEQLLKYKLVTHPFDRAALDV